LSAEKKKDLDTGRPVVSSALLLKKKTNNEVQPSRAKRTAGGLRPLTRENALVGKKKKKGKTDLHWPDVDIGG